MKPTLLLFAFFGSVAYSHAHGEYQHKVAQIEQVEQKPVENNAENDAERVKKTRIELASRGLRAPANNWNKVQLADITPLKVSVEAENNQRVSSGGVRMSVIISNPTDRNILIANPLIRITTNLDNGKEKIEIGSGGIWLPQPPTATKPSSIFRSKLCVSRMIW